MRKTLERLRPSATLQLFLGVCALVFTLLVLTGQGWISRFESEELSLRNAVVAPAPELRCQKAADGTYESGCIALRGAALDALFESRERSPLQLAALFVPLLLILIVLGLLFIRYDHQLRRRIALLRTRLLGALQLEFEPRLGPALEFQPLEDAVGDIYREQRRLSEALTKQIQNDEDTRVAKAVREQLIPPTQFGNERFEFFTHYESARGTGGDWWGFFEVEDKVLVAIGDASGTGFPTAFTIAGVRSSFSIMHRMALDRGDFQLNPSDLLNLINRAVYEIAGSKVMMTLFLGVIDLKEKTITFANAGHNPPWIFRRSGEMSFEKISLMAEGVRLGESLKNPAYEEKTIPLSAGDTFILYTDGLLENKNGAGESFGKKRARALLEANLLSGPKLCLSALVEQLHDHNRGKDLDDDVTVVLIQLLREATRETAAPEPSSPSNDPDAEILKG